MVQGFPLPPRDDVDGGGLDAGEGGNALAKGEFFAGPSIGLVRRS